MSGARMQIAPEQGQFMAQLVRLIGAIRYLEIGVFTGYSSLAVALALPDDGLVVALDRDEKSMAVARRYWDTAGVAGKVESHVGPALESLSSVAQRHGAHSFDFAFIGARCAAVRWGPSVFSSVAAYLVVRQSAMPVFSLSQFVRCFPLMTQFGPH